MISEKNFARDYPSFWDEYTPGFRDFYKTEASIGKKRAKDIEIPEEGIHVYVNNIIATTHYRNIITDSEYSIADSFEDSKPIIDVYSKKRREEYTLTEDYKKIISKQANRLAVCYRGNLNHDPEFPGCGILSNCRGDLLWGKTLVEIKATRDSGRRAVFRPEDFRQLLIYCALNYLAGDMYEIVNIQLFNPRRGYRWEANLDDFVSMISESTTAELFEQIGWFLSDLSETIAFGTGIPDNVY